MRFFTFCIMLLFIGCEDVPEHLTKPTQTKQTFFDENIDPLTYINQKRLNAGMIVFSHENSLELSAKNHALYEVNNQKNGHDEDKNLPYFTGETPSKRALNAGYESANVTENISYTNHIITSIDSLFTAIYHRFGFLSFDKNEIGFYHAQKDGKSSSVFEMGNSYLNELCKSGGERGSGKFYLNTCKNQKLMIKATTYKKATDFANADVVVFPHDGEENADILFSGEEPDPMPSCKILSNPVSVQFNPASKPVKMVSFKLFKNSHEITDTKIISHENDLNKRFSPFEFALFSMKVFEFDTTYSAVFEYIQGGQKKTLKWHFTTKSPKNDYFIVRGGESLSLKPNRDYDLFFYPKNCNDLLKNYKSEFAGYDKISTTAISPNLITVNAQGYKDDKVTISAKHKSVDIYLEETSDILETDNTKRYLIAGFLLLLALFIALRKRK